MYKIEIDEGSGFCFGVTRAIKKAEEELQTGEPLYCLGDIVHNSMECNRLQQLGLKTINHEQFAELKNVKVLLRAHGEPPETYETARQNNIEIIDATCNVVLQLQKRIKQEFTIDGDGKKQIVIFGKQGHAEVLGLIGQTAGKAIVIESLEDAKKLNLKKDTLLYSQTTKSLEAFRSIVKYIEENIDSNASFKYFDTICRQVANRIPAISNFAAQHDVVLFVCGRKSSNGKVLFNVCQSANPNSYMIEGPQEINMDLFSGVDTIGICGATSTPKWLMEDCKKKILEYKTHE